MNPSSDIAAPALTVPMASSSLAGTYDAGRDRMTYFGQLVHVLLEASAAPYSRIARRGRPPMGTAP